MNRVRRSSARATRSASAPPMAGMRTSSKSTSGFSRMMIARRPIPVAPRLQRRWRPGRAPGGGGPFAAACYWPYLASALQQVVWPFPTARGSVLTLSLPGRRLSRSRAIEAKAPEARSRRTRRGALEGDRQHEGADRRGVRRVELVAEELGERDRWPMRGDCASELDLPEGPPHDDCAQGRMPCACAETYRTARVAARERKRRAAASN